MPDFRAVGDSDVCSIKINHGFWEQLSAVFGTFDLGQVLDIAAPANGDPWPRRYLKRHSRHDASLFQIASTCVVCPCEIMNT